MQWTSALKCTLLSKTQVEHMHFTVYRLKHHEKIKSRNDKEILMEIKTYKWSLIKLSKEDTKDFLLNNNETKIIMWEKKKKIKHPLSLNSR